MLEIDLRFYFKVIVWFRGFESWYSWRVSWGVLVSVYGVFIFREFIVIGLG